MPPADPVTDLGERKKEIRRMLADMQQKIFSLSGEEKLAYRAKYDSLLNVSCRSPGPGLLWDGLESRAGTALGWARVQGWNCFGMG